MPGPKAYKMKLVDALFASEFVKEQSEVFIGKMLKDPSFGLSLVNKRKKPLMQRLLSGTSIGRMMIFNIPNTSPATKRLIKSPEKLTP